MLVRDTTMAQLMRINIARFFIALVGYAVLATGGPKAWLAKRWRLSLWRR